MPQLKIHFKPWNLKFEKPCIILSSIQMHLSLHTLSNIQKYVRQKYKDNLWLVKGRLKSWTEYSISTLWWRKNHYHWCRCRACWGWKGLSPLLELQLLKVATTTVVQSHYWTEWITDMTCIQIDRAKGGWWQWIALILYLCLMNICRSMAANLSGDFIKGGGKSFYGELNEDGTFYVSAIAECLPDAMAFQWCVVFS